MKNNLPLRRSALIYTAAALALTLLSTLLRALSLTLSYDASIGYFPAGAVLPILSEILGVASVIFFAVFAILCFRKKETAYAKKPSLAVKIVSGIAAVLSLLLGIYDLKVGASVLTLLFCFGACLYFLLVLTAKTTPALALAFGFCAILRLLSELASSYVDLFVPMNSPEKVWLYVGIVAAMFFLVSEIRALVTKPYTAIWFFSAASATLIVGSTSVALLVGTIHSLFYGRTDDGDLLFALLLLSLAIYAGTRLVTVSLTPLPEEPEEIEETEETEEIKETELTEAFEATEEPKETDEQ